MAFQDLNSKDEWCIIAQSYINKFGPENLICIMNFKSVTMFPQLINIPHFYQSLINFHESKTEKDELNNREDILTTVIWGNSHFTIVK
jgi:hypothetical protein